MNNKVEGTKGSLTKDLVREFGFFALFGLIGLAAYPLAKAVADARQDAKIERCDALRQIVARANRISLISQEAVALSVKDQRWGDPGQRPYLASATADSRQIADYNKRKADALYEKMLELKCDH